MSTVDELADRVLRDFIALPDDQPLTVALNGDITSNATSLTYDDATLAPDEEELLAPGILIEIDTECLRITDVDFDANTLTVTRAVHGTLADAHDDGADITVAPLVLRSTVVEAVKDEVAGLYPSLWHEATTQVTTGSTYVEVPAEVIELVEFVYQDGDQWHEGVMPMLLRRFPPSSTNKAVKFRSVPADRTAHLTYRSRFERPATGATELADLGVEDRWERIVVAGAAASVVAGRPQDILSAEYITEQLEREASPPGVALDARNALLTLRRIWLTEESASLRAEQGVNVTYKRSALRR